MAASYGATNGNGGCISQTKRLLASQGKKLNAGFYIKSVDNFILWTWDIPAKEKQLQIHDSAHKKAEQIAQMVNNKKNHIDTSIMEYIGPIMFHHHHFEKIVKTSDRKFYSTKIVHHVDYVRTYVQRITST